MLAWIRLNLLKQIFYGWIPFQSLNLTYFQAWLDRFSQKIRDERHCLYDDTHLQPSQTCIYNRFLFTKFIHMALAGLQAIVDSTCPTYCIVELNLRQYG